MILSRVAARLSRNLAALARSIFPVLRPRSCNSRSLDYVRRPRAYTHFPLSFPTSLGPKILLSQPLHPVHQFQDKPAHSGGLLSLFTPLCITNITRADTIPR